MANRMTELKRLLEHEPNDPFLRYGMAMEHKKAGDLDEAIAWFDKTLEAEHTYCYAYYHKGQCLESAGKNSEAASVYRKGIEVARGCNDAHAAGEMQAALDLLDD